MVFVLPHFDQGRDGLYDPGEALSRTVIPGSTQSLQGLRYRLESVGDRARGLGASDVQDAAAYLSKSHAALIYTSWTRAYWYEHLKGMSFTVEQAKYTGKGGGKYTPHRTVRLIADQPLGNGPAWNPLPAANRNFDLIGYTTKMACPSFDLPAGALETGGTCPGAKGGQSVVPREKRLVALRLIAEHVPEDKFADEGQALAAAVCQSCYATRGNFVYANIQLQEMLRYLWAHHAMDVPALAPDGSKSTAFIETMTAAIANADFSGGGAPPSEVAKRYGYGHFFRIHSSGDFFNKKYFQQWLMIVRRFPQVAFWAPTRIWAAPGFKWREALAEAGGMPPNLTLRPSAYYVNGQAPVRVQPMSAGTTVFEDKVKGSVRGRFDADCPAYKAKSSLTCAQSPSVADGQTICRACWVLRDQVINYTLHTA